MAFKKELEKFQKHLASLARVSEKELKKISQSGRLHLDSTAIHLKKEHLYYLIGREYIRVHQKRSKGNHLEKLMEEYRATQKEYELLRKQLGKKAS